MQLIRKHFYYNNVTKLWINHQAVGEMELNDEKRRDRGRDRAMGREVGMMGAERPGWLGMLGEASLLAAERRYMEFPSLSAP